VRGFDALSQGVEVAVEEVPGAEKPPLV